MVSGALAGAVAAAATTPLDVCKTLLNTEGKNRSMFNALRHVSYVRILIINIFLTIKYFSLGT